PDRGLYDAMNKGLARAQGDYVIFLNAGDSFHSPDTLQLIADAAMDHDYPGIIYGQTDIVDADRRRIGPRHLTAPEVLEFKSMANGMVVCHQAFVALRKITEPFDLRYRFSADYEWCLRCLKKSKRNQYIDAVLIDYLNEGVTTRNHSKSLMERFKIMCRYYGTLPTIARHFKFLFR
ncbi:MAG: glycosyltransferase, partial [Muribaculaceae bacterium]|nr:glycosyltransferase [Muribaculaceae bacterium]